MATNKDFKVKNGITTGGSVTAPALLLAGTAPPANTVAWIGPNSSSTDWFINTPTGHSTTIGVANAAVMAIGTGAVNVTGIVTATGFSGPLTGNVSGTATTITGVYGGSITSSQVTTALGFAPGQGTVTSASIVTANGVSGSIATATTTPAITLTLGAITPTSVIATGAVAGSTLSSTGALTVGAASGTTFGGTNVYQGDSSIIVVNYAGNTTTYGITLAPTANTITTNPLVFLSSASTPTVPVTVGAIQQLAGNAGMNLQGVWTYGNNAIFTSASTYAGALTSSQVTTALGFTPGTATGTVSSVSIVTANGVSGTVATATTTPAITLTLGAITPSSISTVGAAQLPIIYLNKAGTSGASGISWYNSSTFTAWAQYMAQAGVVNQGPTGNITAPAGTLATTWALRSFIENTANYGWTFESGATNSTTPVVVAEIRSSDGAAKFGGVVTAPSFSGAATGLTSIPAGNLTGTLPNATVQGGTYSMNISGYANTATAIANGAALQIPYQSAANATGFIVTPTVANTYLQWTGGTYSWNPLPFDIAQFINGKPLSSEILVKVIFPRAIGFPANFSSSYAKCVTAATAATTMTVLKNGISVGSVTFAAGATTGTFSTPALTFSAADVMIITANATVDATFADVAFMLTGA